MHANWNVWFSIDMLNLSLLFPQFERDKWNVKLFKFIFEFQKICQNSNKYAKSMENKNTTDDNICTKVGHVSLFLCKSFFNI